MPETHSAVTTALTNIDRAKRLQQYWEALMPYSVPQLPTVVRWCNRYDDDILVEAITATADKASKERLIGIQMSSDNLLRYCSGTCRHIFERDPDDTSKYVEFVDRKDER
jgi:hypothetical protein